jgi:hypothetical protein
MWPRSLAFVVPTICDRHLGLALIVPVISDGRGFSYHRSEIDVTVARAGWYPRRNLYAVGTDRCGLEDKTGGAAPRLRLLCCVPQLDFTLAVAKPQGESVRSRGDLGNCERETERGRPFQSYSHRSVSVCAVEVEAPHGGVLVGEARSSLDEPLEDQIPAPTPAAPDGLGTRSDSYADGRMLRDDFSDASSCIAGYLDVRGRYRLSGSRPWSDPRPDNQELAPFNSGGEQPSLQLTHYGRFRICDPPIMAALGKHRSSRRKQYKNSYDVHITTSHDASAYYVVFFVPWVVTHAGLRAALKKPTGQNRCGGCALWRRAATAVLSWP